MVLVDWSQYQWSTVGRAVDKGRTRGAALHSVMADGIRREVSSAC